MLFRTRYNVLFRQFCLLTAQVGSIPAAIRLIFENCYKIDSETQKAEDAPASSAFLRPAREYRRPKPRG